MIEVCKDIRIDDIVVERKSYDGRHLKVYMSCLTNDDIENFNIDIFGTAFSCGFNFFNGTDNLIRIYHYLNKSPEELINFFKTLTKELNNNRSKYGGFSALYPPAIYALSTTRSEYIKFSKYYEELKKISVNTETFDNFFANPNSGNYINIMMLNLDKMLE